MRTDYHMLDYKLLDEHIQSIDNKDVLLSVHNAGFFSNCTMQLQSLMRFWNAYHQLPDEFNRVHSFMYYKHKATDNLIPMLFKESGEPMPFDRQRYMTSAIEEQQFSDYKKILFDDILPFVNKYFMPSDLVLRRVEYFERKYNIDYENTCAVFYRGNDKHKETKTPAYWDFIDKGQEMPNGTWFFVIPDEQEFWSEWRIHVPESFRFDELPLFPHNPEQSIFHQLEPKDLPDHAVNFFAQVLIAAKCKHLITHSGNASFWTMLYRGNTENVHQFLNGAWL